MKLNKTEKRLLANISAHGMFAVSSGLIRTRRSRLRSYGSREQKAGQSLVRKGICCIVKNFTLRFETETTFKIINANYLPPEKK